MVYFSLEVYLQFILPLKCVISFNRYPSFARDEEMLVNEITLEIENKLLRVSRKKVFF